MSFLLVTKLLFLVLALCAVILFCAGACCTILDYDDASKRLMFSGVIVLALMGVSLIVLCVGSLLL